MTRLVPFVGPSDAEILVLGEAPGREEMDKLTPFVGASGKLTTECLEVVGIKRSACRIGNVFLTQPYKNKIREFFTTKAETIKGNGVAWKGHYVVKDRFDDIKNLEKELSQSKAKLIIAFGNTPMWATTGTSTFKNKTPGGITNWRSSLLWTDNGIHIKVLPTYHPADVLRVYADYFFLMHDLRKAKAESAYPEIRTPNYRFVIRPSFHEATRYLRELLSTLSRGPLRVAFDIETRWGQKQKHIACYCLAHTELDAICIPLMCVERPSGYWTNGEESAILSLTRQVLTHKNAQVVVQKGSYDCQYTARYWGFIPNIHHDTFLAQHVLFPGTPKDLNTISSLHCAFHTYWKNEGKDWEPGVDEEQLWVYNCKDGVTTYESSISQEEAIAQVRLSDQLDFVMSLFRPVLRMMLRGVKCDQTRRGQLAKELFEYTQSCEQWFKAVVGDIKLAKSKTAKPWYRSAIQQRKLFYDVMKLRPIFHRKTGQPTVDDEALKTLGEREPIIRPMCTILAKYRSAGVLLSNVLDKGIDHDGRIRCEYNIGGTETFRFSSSEDAFGYGFNLQNITSGEEEQ
jgi:uracil-DNA glycosylase